MKINELTIYSSNLEGQLNFYSRILGLPLLHQNDISFTIAVGKSNLIFKYREKMTPYHFAINIPSNQSLEALSWLRKRVDILKNGKDLLVDFINWNALSVYFYDAEQNIVELIARKNLHIQSIDTFDYHAFLSVSEVGIPVSDIETVYKQLPEMPVYDGDFQRFCAVGDEYGLFIMVNKQLKNWFPTNDTAYSSEFSILFENAGKTHLFEFRSEEFRPVPIP